VRAFEKQQDKFRKEEAYIRKYKAGQRAKQAQGRQSKLDRDKRDSTLERPVELETLDFDLPRAPRAGDLVAVARGISKRYALAPGAARDEYTDPDAASKILFDDFDVTISRGERWGIIGPNGAGKSTLVRGLLGQLPLDAGSVKLGSNVVVGYYSQTGDEADENLAVYEYLQLIIKRENPGTVFSEQQARDLAGAFLFSGKDQDKRIGSLSGGERSRARLAGLLASAKNLLILDEPTNHLDISSAERLEDVLAAPSDDDDGRRSSPFDGTMILISHDRALIDATCEHLIVLDGHGGAEVFHGNYTDWHRKQIERAAARKAAEAEALRRREADEARKKTAASAKPTATGARNGSPTSPGAKHLTEKSALSWMSSDRLEQEIAALEARVKQIDDLLTKEDVYCDAARCRDLLWERDQAQDKLRQHEEEWLRRAE
ncbi:MAG: ATP-binding cassette domain-containing protein, partial [Phycisphaerales bacterium]